MLNACLAVGGQPRVAPAIWCAAWPRRPAGLRMWLPRSCFHSGAGPPAASPTACHQMCAGAPGSQLQPGNGKTSGRDRRWEPGLLLEARGEAAHRFAGQSQHYFIASSLFSLVQDGVCGTGSCWGEDRNGMLSHQQWGWDKSLQAESFPE